VRRRFGLIVLALLPAFVAPWVAAKLADRFGQRLGAALAETVAGSRWLAPAAVEAPPAATPVPHEMRAPQPTAAEPPAAARSTRSRSRRAAAPAPTFPARGLRVSAETVLRIARSGMRPNGTPVAASQGCAAGLRLSGVGALGVGLRDGDILTHAAGRPAASRADVVGTVIAARGARKLEVSGRFCRDGEAWNLVVEQPYPRSAAEIEGAVASRSVEGR
jgi:hypothetical protein